MRLPHGESIGPPQCPLMDRWTLFFRSDRWPKLLLHHFLPDREDRDMHDHPRSFVTVILKGTYDDMVPCECGRGGCEGLKIGEVMRPGMVRWRRAEHAHLTRTRAEGCWTLVLMMPKSREWGFWRAGQWWPFRDYENIFGFAMRCGEEETPYHITDEAANPIFRG